MIILSTLVVMVLSYIIGSINISILLFRLLGFSDPRKQFSKNAGVTNVYRQAGPLWAAVVLILDVGKAAFIAFLALTFLDISTVPLAALMLVLGNRFPCFHGFKGGKGVASYIGFTGMISPIYTLLALLAWVVVYVVSKVPFIASMVTLLCLSFGLLQYTAWQLRPAVMILVITSFLVLNHRQNFKALYEAADHGKN